MVVFALGIGEGAGQDRRAGKVLSAYLCCRGNKMECGRPRSRVASAQEVNLMISPFSQDSNPGCVPAHLDNTIGPDDTSSDVGTAVPPNRVLDIFRVAQGYTRLGFSVVPQLPGAKHPCVKWKPFQERRPT